MCVYLGVCVCVCVCVCVFRWEIRNPCIVCLMGDKQPIYRGHEHMIKIQKKEKKFR